MKFNAITQIKSFHYIVASAALVIATPPAYSEYYMGLDATYMNTKIVYGNASASLTLNPARIKFGQRFKEFGWEIQGLTPSDDTGGISGGGFNTYKLRAGIGLLLTVSTPGRGFYGGIGFTQILADTSYLDNLGTLISSSTHSYPFTTVNFGGQYEVSKNARISLDYTFYHGQIDCNFCVNSPSLPANTFNSDPDVRLSTIGLGFNYSF